MWPSLNGMAQLYQIDQAACFRFLRHPSRPNTPRPVAKSGSPGGIGTVASLMTAAWTHPVEFVRVVASLMPRELEAAATVTERMSDAQLEAIIARDIEGGLDPAATDEDANMTVSENPLSRSLLGVKRT